MAEATAKKLNISFPEATEFTLFPLSFSGKHKSDKDFNPFTKPNGGALPRAEMKVLALIYTETKNFGSAAKITLAHIRKKCGLSKGGAKNAVNNLIARKLIEKNKFSGYKIVPKINDKRYIVLDSYLHTTKFDVAGTTKKLSQTAVIVFDRICSFYREFKIDPETGEKIYINYNFKTRKVINYFCGSEASIAKYFGLPKSTVSYAILELMHAKILFRNKRLRYKDENDNVKYKIVHTKETTGNTLSLFTVPYEALAVEQRSTYKAQEIEFNEELTDIEVTEAEIQAAYTKLRTEAKAKAEQARAIADGDKEFCNLQAKLLNANRFEFDKIAQRYIKRLTVLGITEEELNPQYQCTLCDDTGTNIDTGQRCICRHRIKQSIIKSKFKA